MTIENWPAFFYEAITSLGSRLDEAMRAEGSRAGWLQTEVMLYGRRRTPQAFIYPNYTKIADKGRMKFDFAAYENDEAEGRLLAVAQLQIMAGHFIDGWKCLTGGGAWVDLEGLGEAQRFQVPAARIEACKYPYGLVPDARRLLAFKNHLTSNDKHVGTYLILVLLELSRYSQSIRSQNLHRAMDCVQFGSAEYRSATPSMQTYKVKVWTL